MPRENDDACAENYSAVIPGSPISAFTRVFDALWAGARATE